MASYITDRVSEEADDRALLAAGLLGGGGGTGPVPAAGRVAAGRATCDVARAGGLRQGCGGGEAAGPGGPGPAGPGGPGGGQAGQRPAQVAGQPGQLPSPPVLRQTSGQKWLTVFFKVTL